MTLFDIVARLGLGLGGLLVFVILYVAILVPIMSRIGKFLRPEGDEATQLAWGFLALLMGSTCVIAAWFLGDWLFVNLWKIEWHI